MNLRNSPLEELTIRDYPKYTYESGYPLHLRKELGSGKPKIISTLFVYCVQIHLELLPLFYEEDFPGITEIDEYSSYDRPTYEKEVYFCYNQKPDLIKLEENIKTALEKRLPIRGNIFIRISLSEEIIKRENDEEI